MRVHPLDIACRCLVLPPKQCVDFLGVSLYVLVNTMPDDSVYVLIGYEQG
jgi:hypothetical protein